MSFKRFTLSFALVSLVALPAVLAQPPATRQGQSQDPLSIYREAGVTPVQEAKIREMAKEFDNSNSVKLHRLMNLLQEMKTLSLTPDLDEKTTLAKQDEINKVQAENANDRVRLLVKIRALLNADQKKKLVELMQKQMDSSPPSSSK